MPKKTKENNNKPIVDDKIVQVDSMNQYMDNMSRYSLYIWFERFVPNINDGLKPVQRRILYCMYNDVGCTSLAKKRKSANTMGMVIALYHAHNCLSGNTKVFMLNGMISTLKELYNNNILSFEALGVDPVTLKTVPVQVHDLRIGQITNKLYHIEFSNGSEICCTSNHPFMLNDGSYKRADELTCNDILYNVLYYTQTPHGESAIFDNLNKRNISDDKFKNNSPYITNIWIEDVINEVTYDFTAESVHNMLFPLIGSNNDNNNFPLICLKNSEAAYGTAKCLTNWFECKTPLICYDSLSGSIQGGTQAAARYTESYLSEFAMEVVLADLIECRSCVDWSKTFDGRTLEPNFLPAKVPLLLVIGTFSIVIGERVEIPPHSLNDVIDATLDVLHNPNAKVILIPDPCQKCELIETDWKAISNQGYGKFTERGILETVKDNNGNVYISIRSVPDLVWPNSIMEKIDELITSNKLTQIADIQDHSTDDQLDIRIYLKKGSDPEYVKQILYKHTTLQDNKRVNMQVIIQEGPDLRVSRMSYKAYIVNFINMRREVKFRMYNSKLQKVETRLHTIEIYIKILESGEVDKIIHMIRNRTQSEEAQLVEWLMKKLDITDLQAKFILNTPIKNLSKGNLSKYKDEQKELLNKVNNYIKIITTPELIDQEIEQELIYIRNKYGKPRQSVIISKNEVNNIPSGTFQVSVYNNGMLRKSIVGEPLKIIKNAVIKSVCVGDNAKDILLFDEMGKVFKLPISKLPLSDKSNNGIDVKYILKKLTSNIVSAIYLPLIEELIDKKSKHYLVICTREGYIKRIDLDDIITSTNSGIIYSKLNKSDFVADILITNSTSDILIYTNNRVLRCNINNIPYVKRSSIGNIGIKTNNSLVHGISIINNDMTDIVIITESGKISRIKQIELTQSLTNRAGSKVIKLNKTDSIIGVFGCNNTSIIRCNHIDNSCTDINVNQLQYSSVDSSSYSFELNKSVSSCIIIKL